MNVYGMDDLELWRERRAELTREAERDRLAKELRKSRKRRARLVSAPIWELKRLTGRLRKLRRALKAGDRKTDR